MPSFQPLVLQSFPLEIRASIRIKKIVLYTVIPHITIQQFTTIMFSIQQSKLALDMLHEVYITSLIITRTLCDCRVLAGFLLDAISYYELIDAVGVKTRKTFCSR